MKRVRRIQRVPRILAAFFGAIACTSGSLAQEEFCGAEGIIQQICVDLPDEAAQAAKPELPIEALREEARAFAEIAADLPPEAAAAGWLAIVDRFNELLDQPGSGVNIRGYSYSSKPVAFDLVIGALPPPPAWPALAEAVRQRELGEGSAAHREHCLRILVALLLGEDGPQFESLAAIKRLFTGTTDDEYYVRENARELQQLADALAESSDDPRHALDAFETLIALAAQDPEGDRLLQMTGIDVPNLVALGGEVEAERLLRRAVLTPALLNLTGDASTRALAQRVALEHVGEMVVPQWRLCFEMQDTALYDALRERFVTKREEARRSNADRFLDQQSRLAGQFNGREIGQAEQGARWHYLARLILDERYDDAHPVALGLEQPETWVYHMYGRYDRDYTAAGLIRRSPQAGRAFEFFAELLREAPAFPFWQLLIDLGAQLGRQDEVLAAMEGVGPEDVGDQDHRFRTERRRLFLARGQTDMLIAELRAAMREPFSQERKTFPSRSAQDLARLGRDLARPELIDEVAARLRELHYAREDHTAGNAFAQVAMDYSALGRGPTAESILAELLADHLARSIEDPGVRSAVSAPALLARLVQVYHRADRHRDVLVLTDEATWWGAKDVRDIRTEFSRAAGDAEATSLPLAIATALQATGRRAEARHIVEAVLDDYDPPDAAFAILVELDGLAAIRRFDDMLRRDRTDERPLVWKARALLDAGQIDAAARLAEQALALDPSDEDGQRGWRLHGLSVLADAREAQGQDEAAARLRQMLRAVRIAEDGDVLCAGGRVREGVKAYRSALRLYEEAYCVHVRLGQRLLELGETDDAVTHLRRGYELMPDSFGRLPRGCYGRCDTLFNTEFALRIAEAVFDARLARGDESAALHYLVALVRERDNRLEDAVVHLRKALELDDEHTLAASRLVSLSHEVPVAWAETDRAGALLYRMSPLRYGRRSGSLGGVRDLRLVWETAASVEPITIPAPDSLYVLAAARDQIEKAEAAQIEAGQRPGGDGRGPMTVREAHEIRTRTPGEAIASHSTVQQIVRIYGARIGP